jgi:hypothetical protein
MKSISSNKKHKNTKLILGIVAGAVIIHLIWVVMTYRDARSSIPVQVTRLTIITNAIETLRQEKTPYAHVRVIESINFLANLQRKTDIENFDFDEAHKLKALLQQSNFKIDNYLIDHFNKKYLKDGHAITQEDTEILIKKIANDDIVKLTNSSISMLVIDNYNKSVLGSYLLRKNSPMDWVIEPFYLILDKLYSA